MWLSSYYILADATASVGGAGSTTEVIQLVSTGLNLGVLGIVFWLFVGGKLHSSDEMDREVAGRERAEQQRDEALKVAQEQVVPLLTSFVGTTSALLPLLQDLVAMREELRRGSRRPGDRGDRG